MPDHPTRCVLAVAACLLALGACSSTADRTTPTTATDAAATSVATSIATSATTGAPPTATPTSTPDVAAAVEASLTTDAPPGPDALGAPWSAELLRRAGADADLADAAAEAEANLLADAAARVDPIVPASVPPTTPAGFARRQAAGTGGFGSVGLALVVLADGLTTTPGVQASASAGTTSQGPSASGSVSFGVEGGIDASGSGTAGVEMTIDVTSDDGRTASVRIAAHIAGLPCPDENGRLELRFDGTTDVTWSGATTGHGTQHFAGTLTAHFDDDGEASEIDLAIDVEVSRSAGSGSGSYVEFTYDATISGLYGASPSVSATATIDRASSRFDANAVDDARMAGDAREMASRFALGAFTARRGRVQDNGCVVVEARAPATASPRQAVPVDVHTRHVVEQVELDARVAATLSGAGTIDPDRLPATPGTITYTAGEHAGDAGTITFESRSRRGIGTATVMITVQPAYRIDQSVGDLHFSGIVCGFDQPFTLTSDAAAPGAITFTPAATGSGTYDGSGQVGQTPGIMRWSGTYAFQAVDGDSPTLRMDDGTTIITNIPKIGQVPVPGFWQGGVTFELTPVDGC